MLIFYIVVGVTLIHQLYVHFTDHFLVPIFMKGFCCVMGFRGTGKSSLATIYSQYYIKKGIPVYSNFPIAGCYLYDPDDLGNYMIQNCALILDEAGIDMSNRKLFEKSYRGITENNRKWWKKSRHYGVDQILILSQSFDFDQTLRRLASKHFIISRRFSPLLPNWSYLIPLKQKWDISPEGTDPIIRLYIPKFFYLWFNRKPSYGLYDSWEIDELENKYFPLVSYPEHSPKSPIREKILHCMDILYLQNLKLMEQGFDPLSLY